MSPDDFSVLRSKCRILGGYSIVYMKWKRFGQDRRPEFEWICVVLGTIDGASIEGRDLENQSSSSRIRILSIGTDNTVECGTRQGRNRRPISKNGQWRNASAAFVGLPEARIWEAASWILPAACLSARKQGSLGSVVLNFVCPEVTRPRHCPTAIGFPIPQNRIHECTFSP